MPYKAGSAFVSVVPSFRGFQTRIAAEAKRVKAVEVPIDLKVSDRAARAKMAEVTRTRTTKVKVDVDTRGAMAQLSRLESRLDRLARGRFLINAAIAASPLAVPAIAAGGAAAGGLLAAGGAAAAGVGGFAALGAASLNKAKKRQEAARNAGKAVREARGGVADARQAVASATTAKAAASARRDLAAATKQLNTAEAQHHRILAKITPAQKQALAGVASLKMAWSGFLDRISGPVLGSLVQGMQALKGVLPAVGAFIRPVAKSLGAMFDVIGNAAGGKGFRQFARTLGEFAAGIIPRAAGMVLNLAKGFGSLFQAFMPVGTQMSDGLLHLTQRFAAWAATVGKSQGFRRFIAYVRQNGPALMQTLGSIGSALVSVGKALAPLAAAMVRGIGVAARWLAGFAKAHPTVVRVAAAVGIFAAGLSAIAGPIAKVVGAVGTLIKVGTGLFKVIRIVIFNARLLFFVLSANPIGLVITAVVALGAGLVIAYKKSETFRKIVNAAWRGIKAAALAVWNWLKKNFVPFFTHTIPDAFGRVVDFIKKHWKSILVGIVAGPFGLVFLAIRKNWDKIKSAFRSGIAWVVDKFLGFVGTLIHGAAKAFGWVPKLGSKLRGAAADFDKFRRNVNNSIRGIDEHKNVWIKAKWGINERSGGITLTSAAGIAFSGKGRIPVGMAIGGAVNGPGGPRDDRVPAMLSNGEHVFTASDVKKAGGQDAMYAIRAMIQRGEFAKKGDLQKYADGGAVGVHSQTRSASRQASHSLSQVDNLYNRVAKHAGDALKEVLSRLVKNLSVFGAPGKPLGPGGTLSAGQILRGQQFAKSQAGKPYVWGGVGPYGYDCSGFQSAVYNASVGRNPYQRLGSTSSMPWPGMRPGVGRYTIGWFTGSPGHTAGNIGGLGVESRGGDGVVVGGGARSPLNSMFNHVAHYSRGGGVSGPGSPTSDSIPALLSDGEFVVNAAATSRNRGLLESINAQHFAKGGRVGKKGQRQIDRAFKHFTPQDTGREMVDELRDLKGTLRDVLGRKSPLIDRADRIGSHMTDQAQRMVKWTRSVDRLTDQRRDLVQKRNTLRGSVADQFRNDPFGGGLADLSLQLRADRNDARRMRRALQTARRKGLSGGLFTGLAQSGNFTLAQEFAHSSRAEIRHFEHLFSQRQHASRAAGGFVAQQVYGHDLRQNARETRHLTRSINHLERRMSRFEHKLEHAVEKGVRNGSRQGGARQRARSR